ncbi:hypothetical protein [Deinococcus multiflagellatus]|uniref:Uncharacterized protein n=1 Tax=Deinococcus multiflagellatus TaxID=1656887 RepID=A0ABW1ZGV4_9DEIO|nr:hypothetical protein [Deinococcus multiflagellatus]MBZ9713756.1 hypothetical protein [Deinococcus multiflagellatus]
MNNLITPTGLRIAGQWLKPGDAVPGDVPGFDYEKAARKGLLKDTEGGEIRNLSAEQPVPEPVAQAVHKALTGERTYTYEEFSRVQQDRDALQRQLDAEQRTTTRLRGELTDAQAKAADPADAAALAEYRDVVGDLLSSTFPARKVLFENGYYTADSVRYADDEALLAVRGIADATLAEIRKLAPHPADEPQG